VDLPQFLELVNSVQRDARALVAEAGNAEQLAAARTALVGRKSGRLTELMRVLPSLSDSQRRHAGAAVNQAKQAIEALLDEAGARTSQVAASANKADLTMPARESWRGGLHPVTVVLQEIEEIFGELGFTVATGPEVETPWYNFQALNFPENHPAMDMHDTLYVGANALLRTHTSPVQIRTLQAWPPPIRVLVPGKFHNASTSFCQTSR
jgi:phenylalanyl-tRNA synthetase alpha chain